VLHNGAIATMDARNTIARSVVIRGDRVAAVGTARGIPPHDACATVVDLRGRTVVPGLIDSHDHIVQLSLRPGHVTGRNSAGEVIEPADQLLTRTEALRMYTANQGWFTHDEKDLGSIEAGKLADLVVLSDDVLDPRKVPDAAIKRVHSVTTIVGGKVVYDAARPGGS